MSNKNDKHNKKKGGYIFNFLNNSMNFLNNSMNFLNNSMNFILIITLIYILYYLNLNLFAGTQAAYDLALRGVLAVSNTAADGVEKVSYTLEEIFLFILRLITQSTTYLQELITAIILKIILSMNYLSRIIRAPIDIIQDDLYAFYTTVLLNQSMLNINQDGSPPAIEDTFSTPEVDKLD